MSLTFNLEGMNKKSSLKVSGTLTHNYFCNRMDCKLKTQFLFCFNIKYVIHVLTLTNFSSDSILCASFSLKNHKSVWALAAIEIALTIFDPASIAKGRRPWIGDCLSLEIIADFSTMRCIKLVDTPRHALFIWKKNRQLKRN